MRYLITAQQELFASEAYTSISVEQSLQMLERLLVCGLDTETKGFDPYTKPLLLVQIGNFKDQFAIDTSTIDITLYKKFFENKNRLFILHNAKFDIRFFFHKRIIINKVYDTFLAEKLLYLGYPSGMHSMSLEACCMRYFNVQLDKSVRSAIHREGLSERVIVYGCDDVKHLIPLMEEQLKELEKKGLLEAIKVENRFVPVLAYVEYCGMKLSKEKWLQKMDKDAKDYAEKKKILDDWIVEHNDSRFIKHDLQGDLFTGFSGPQCNINWASSKQVIPLLESLGFNLETKDKETGQMKKSVESPIIEGQKDISDIAPLYLDFKKAEKIVSTYGQGFINAINPVSGRIHTQFNQLMDTTRLSCGGKDLDTGQDNINFQNIPSDEDTRACFVSEEGYSLIDCDYTAQEDFVFTEASREPKLIAFYNDKTRKRDGHSFVAKLVYHEELKDITEEEVKKKAPEKRTISKKAKFALHYGGNGLTVSKNLSISLDEGNRFEILYYQAFPDIKKYFDYIKRISWEQGYVLISPITGHKAYIYDWSELRAAQSKFNREFWDEYRKYKPAYEFSELGNNASIRNRYIRDIFTEFSKGTSIEEIAEDYNISKACIYVEIVKHFFKRKGACERMALNYPRMYGASYSNIC